MTSTVPPLPRCSAAICVIADSIPPEISKKPFIVFTARSRWSLPDPIDGRLYDTGFEIIKMDIGEEHDDVTELQRFSVQPVGRLDKSLAVARSNSIR